MNEPTITVDLAPSDAEIHSAIRAGLRAFNIEHAGLSERRPFAVFVRDADGVALGGLEGEIRWQWVFVDNFFLPEALRGRGIGSALLDAAERLGAEHGCVGSYLDTFEFQALPFYEKRGYTVYGVLDDYPPGFKRYYLRKRFEKRSRAAP
jgi:GNAT superfamily N-acetyltransferase